MTAGAASGREATRDHLDDGGDGLSHLFGGGEAVRRLLLQATQDDVVDAGGQPLDEERGCGRGLLRVGQQHRRQRGLDERRPTREAGKEHGAQGIDIGAAVDGFAQGLLGREEDRRTQHRSRRRQRRRRHEALLLGDAEVDELGLEAAFGARHEHDVLRLDVSVHDAVGVGLVQGAGDLLDDVAGLFERERVRFVVDAIAQRPTLQQLHCIKNEAFFGDTTVKDLDDAGVGDRGERLDLALEAGELVLPGVGGQLERDLGLQRRVEGAPHLAHPAAADQLDEAVAADELVLAHLSPQIPRDVSGAEHDDPRCKIGQHVGGKFLLQQRIVEVPAQLGPQRVGEHEEQRRDDHGRRRSPHPASPVAGQDEPLDDEHRERRREGRRAKARAQEHVHAQAGAGGGEGDHLDGEDGAGGRLGAQREEEHDQRRGDGDAHGEERRQRRPLFGGEEIERRVQRPHHEAKDEAALEAQHVFALLARRRALRQRRQDVPALVHARRHYKESIRGGADTGRLRG